MSRIALPNRHDEDTSVRSVPASCDTGNGTRGQSLFDHEIDFEQLGGFLAPAEMASRGTGRDRPLCDHAARFLSHNARIARKVRRRASDNGRAGEKCE